MLPANVSPVPVDVLQMTKCGCSSERHCYTIILLGCIVAQVSCSISPRCHVPCSAVAMLDPNVTITGVRDGGGQGAAAPPIRAVSRHEFGQRVDIIRAKHNN